MFGEYAPNRSAKDLRMSAGVRLAAIEDDPFDRGPTKRRSTTNGGPLNWSREGAIFPAPRHPKGSEATADPAPLDRMWMEKSMLSQRQAQFRSEYRSRIVGWYNGYFHIMVIYLLGAAALFYYIQHVRDVRWWEWLTVPIVFLACNIFEWVVHRYVMHRPIDSTGARAVYNRHTLNHHQFFSDTEMRFRDHKDWRVTVFPPFALVAFTMMSIVPALVMGLVVSGNVGWLVICTTTSMYLIYEFMHFCCHVKENWFVRNCPFVNTLRRHHYAHHNTRLMMEVNMNLTFPIADWLFGTSDLNRGLLGHLFNGYSARHVKKDLRGQPTGPSAMNAGLVLTE